jgi:hypothetical protein
VRDALYDATTKGIVTSSNTANNHLLYTLFEGGGHAASEQARPRPASPTAATG